LILLATLAWGGWLWYVWTQPAVIQQMLIAQLQEQFEDVDVEMESAHLRLFGGIVVRNLRLIRRDDPLREPFLVVPSGKLLHDKEHFAKKKLRIRKIELDNAEVRIERRLDGTFNLMNLLKPSSDNEPVPTFVLRNTRITIVDRNIGPEVIATMQSDQITLMNDPVSQLTIEGVGKITPLGPVRFSARMTRENQRTTLNIELPNIAVNNTLLKTVALYQPQLLEAVDHFEGVAKVKMTLDYDPNTTPQFHHETRLEVHHARVTHPELPLPLENLEVIAVCRDGYLTVEKIEAKAGDATITANLELLPPSADGPMASVPISFNSEDSLPEELERRLKKLEFHIDHLLVQESLFNRLPEQLKKVQKMFSPSGPISLTFLMSRAANGWTKRCVFRPQGLSATFDKFAMPVEDLQGTLDFVMTHEKSDRLDIDLVGKANGKKITIKGFFTDHRGKTNVDVRLNGNNLPLSEALLKALPPKAADFVRQLRATANGDFIATIKQLPGTNLLSTEFRIQIQDGKFQYDLFPLLIEHVNGLLVIAPQPTDMTKFTEPNTDEINFNDVIELKGFTASHGGAQFTLNGKKGPSAAGSTLVLNIEGRGLPLDDDLMKAMTGLKMDTLWKTLRPSGATNCSIQLLLHERPPPTEVLGTPTDLTHLAEGLPFDPINDLEATVSLSGGGVKPDFFPLQVFDIGGRIEYAHGKVDLHGLRGRYGNTRLDIQRGEVRLRPDGGVWSDLRNVMTTPIQLDANVLAALPPGMRNALKDLDVRGPLEIDLTQLVIDDPAPPPLRSGVRQANFIPVNDPPPTVYWHGTVTMRGNSFQTGVPWENVNGKIASIGRFEGDKFGRVVGNVVIDDATILKQSLSTMHSRFEIDPRQPDVVQIPWIQGQVYGGELGGEGRLLIGGPKPLFDLKLNATRLSLEQVAKGHNLGPNAHVEGLATAQLFISNRTESDLPAAYLYGGGSVDVPSGKMLNLPAMLDLFKLLNLRVPDQTAFEEAHAVFQIQGDRIHFSQLDLLGNAISLGGEGDLNLATGATKLEFYTIWSRWLKGWLQTPVGEVAAEISSMLFKIEVKGDYKTQLDFRKVTVPVIVDPVRKVFERMRKSNLIQRGGGMGDGN